MSGRCSTTTALRCAWATTARGRCTAGSASPRPRGRRLPSTTRSTRSTDWSQACGTPSNSSAGTDVRLEQIYQEVILDHYKHPHRRGLREPFGAEVHHVNPTCGDEVTLRVKVSDGVVEDVSYDGAGCSISQASTSVLTDLVVGKPVEEAVAVQ